MNFAANDISYVEIFPPIGIARVGDSDEYYIGSEVPGVISMPEDGKFKDARHRIRKQAVCFHAYAYDKDSNLLGEVVNDEEYKLTWTVHVANKKGAWFVFRGRYEEPSNQLRNPKIDSWTGGETVDRDFPDTRARLIIDSQERSVAGTSAEPVKLEGMFWTIQETATSVCLGDIRTDNDGRLIVCASDGHSCHVKGSPYGELTTEYDNNDWIDNMCDGTIRVSVKSTSFPDISIKSKHKATVISGPPKYASAMQSPTTLFDLIENIYEKRRAQANGTPKDFVGGVEYYRHIVPIFQRLYPLSWVSELVDMGHGPNNVGSLPGYPELLKSSAEPRPKPLAVLKRKCSRQRGETIQLDIPAASHSKDMLGDGSTIKAAVLEDTESVCPVQGTSNVNKKDKEKERRQEILMRIRKAVVDGDKANLDERTAQAGPGYMPVLNGNDGNERDGKGRGKARGNLWSSLTELQYHRLSRWADGDFDVGEPIAHFKTLKEMPLAMRPGALTEAALEWSIGDPMFPGIELGWTAQLNEMYDLYSDFRFAESVRPGDLTKGLSLPWQSDFFQCRDHWWPSARPDEVVTEDDFNKKLKDTDDIESLVYEFTERQPWHRGINRAEDTDNPYVLMGGMVQKWNQLGFIKRQTYGTGSNLLPIFSEAERDPQLDEAHGTSKPVETSLYERCCLQ